MNVAVAIRWILLLGCARQLVSVDIRLLYPHFKMSQQVMHCLYCCGFFTSCCGVSDITCTDLTTTNTLNDAMIQNFKLCDINCLCLLRGQEVPPHQVVEGEKDEVWYSQDLCQHLLASVEWQILNMMTLKTFCRRKVCDWISRSTDNT